MDVELLEAIVCDGDNLTYGTIISVYADADAAITALTDDSIEELHDMLRDARRNSQTWHGLLDDVKDDPVLADHLKTQTPR